MSQKTIGPEHWKTQIWYKINWHSIDKGASEFVEQETKKVCSINNLLFEFENEKIVSSLLIL